MTEFRADLHCHSTCSDGTLTPQEIVLLAKQSGITALSITDHDTVEAYSTIKPLCEAQDIILVPGVEFSAFHLKTSVHLLAYGFAPDHPEILALCARHTERRTKRNRDILDLLAKHNMPLTEEDLHAPSSESSPSKHVIGRPHIAMAMVKKGYVESFQEAFRKYIAEGRCCFAQGELISVEETIGIVHRAKGVVVIAHPQLIKKPHILSLLLTMNFDGIECFYGRPYFTDHKRWTAIAKKKNWLITGGSDFHGAIKPDISLGCSWIDEPTFRALQAKIQQIQ